MRCSKCATENPAGKKILWRMRVHARRRMPYGWFSEGFDTADLKEAKVLLDQLAR
jgi:hypothetical protein